MSLREVRKDPVQVRDDRVKVKTRLGGKEQIIDWNFLPLGSPLCAIFHSESHSLRQLFKPIHVYLCHYPRNFLIQD